MGVFKETCYGLMCDGCETGFEHPWTGFSFWTDSGSPVDEATERDWVEHEGKYYCPDCYTIDEETEEIIIKSQHNNV